MQELTNKLYLILGSTGNRYFVRRKNGNWECTCKGWRYNHKCYHVTNKKKEVEKEDGV